MQKRHRMTRTTLMAFDPQQWAIYNINSIVDRPTQLRVETTHLYFPNPIPPNYSFFSLTVSIFLSPDNIHSNLYIHSTSWDQWHFLQDSGSIRRMRSLLPTILIGKSTAEPSSSKSSLRLIFTNVNLGIYLVIKFNILHYMINLIYSSSCRFIN